jgi:hypothetical protein
MPKSSEFSRRQVRRIRAFHFGDGGPTGWRPYRLVQEQTQRSSKSKEMK